VGTGGQKCPRYELKGTAKSDSGEGGKKGGKGTGQGRKNVSGGRTHVLRSAASGRKDKEPKNKKEGPKKSH